MDIINITPPAVNKPGMAGFILLAELEWFATFGATVDPVVIPGDEMRIDTAHTFETGKGFVRWDTEDDIAQVMLPIVGSRSSLGYKPEADLFFPGIDPVKAWSFIQNKSFIGLFPIFGCGSTQYLQLGDECNPLRILPSDGFKTGVAGGNDPRGFRIKLGNNYSVYFYESDVTAYPPPEEEV
jgi:hypothetical protein